MPAKIIFIAATVIVVAGIVVYDNREHVYEFVDRTRRKVKNSLHALAQEINPQREPIPMTNRGPFSESYRENEGEKVKPYNEERSERGEKSFTKGDEAYGFASSSSREQYHNEYHTPSAHVRHRGQQFGTMPENLVVFDASTESSRMSTPRLDPISRRSSTETLQLEKPLPQMPAEPPALPPKPQSLAVQPSPELSVISDPFVDVAEVQEAAEPIEQQKAVSSRTVSSGEDQEDVSNPFESSQPYWSIHEWASAAHTPSSAPSLAGSAPEEIEQPADDILSDFGSDVESVGSWTEVGSSVSGDDN
ncbi:hypothetical protein DFP73DRAFT_594302 [Morchella snyderi]|nr:hypothetical protein DFP73DRAFT_594302 [Morchella snyderi]